MIGNLEEPRIEGFGEGRGVFEREETEILLWCFLVLIKG